MRPTLEVETGCQIKGKCVVCDRKLHYIFVIQIAERVHYINQGATSFSSQKHVKVQLPVRRILIRRHLSANREKLFILFLAFKINFLCTSVQFPIIYSFLAIILKMLLLSDHLLCFYMCHLTMLSLAMAIWHLWHVSTETLWHDNDRVGLIKYAKILSQCQFVHSKSRGTGVDLNTCIQDDLQVTNSMVCSTSYLLRLVVWSQAHPIYCVLSYGILGFLSLHPISSRFSMT